MKCHGASRGHVRSVWMPRILSNEMPRVLSNEMPWGMHPSEIIVLGIDGCPFSEWSACGVGKPWASFGACVA